MQTLFGISLTTLAGYLTFFGLFFVALLPTPGIPHWAQAVCAGGLAVCGALRLAVGHMMNDAPASVVPPNPPAKEQP